jgi:hypothetical protein
MLTITSHLPAFAGPSRRAFKAAVLAVRLSGLRLEDCSTGSGSLPPSCIYAPSAKLVIIPTCADRPLLLAQAEELVRSVQEDAIIVRLRTWPQAQHLVTFDLFRRQDREVAVSTGFRPCCFEGREGLWLVGGADDDVLALGTEGLRRRQPPTAALRTNAMAGITAAENYFRSHIWGGL